MDMLYVCCNHVTKGLKEVDTPHIEKISAKDGIHCKYCHEEATYHLYYFGKVPAAVCTKKRLISNLQPL